jgi:hypothetical protein
MLKLSLIGAILVAITVVIHAVGTTLWVSVVIRRVTASGGWRMMLAMTVLIRTVIVLVALHILEIVLWAVAYRAMVPDSDLATFEQAVYFSFVTFTTLGFGDITLSESWRLLSGIEALNGILLVGWTTAMIFTVVQRIWHGLVSVKNN